MPFRWKSLHSPPFEPSSLKASLIKFQGETDHATARRFAAVLGSELRHLFHNRHELTWSKID
jgi:hypothetical protein